MGRRHPGEGGLYQRADGMWCGNLDLGWVDGKRRRKVVYAKTSTAALRKLNTVRRQLAEQGHLPTADITVAKWLTYWLDEIAARRVKPTTFASYRTSVTQFITPAIGRHRLSKLAPQHVREMHAFILGRGKSSTTALNAHRILSAALNDAVRDGRIPRNVAALVRAPAKAVSKRTGLTAEQAIAVLTQASKDTRLGSRWLAAFLLGVRQGERLGLRWSHVDLDAGLADLSWALTRVAWEHGCGGTCGKVKRACPAKRLPIPEGMEYEVLYGNLVLMRPKTVRSVRIVPLPLPLLLALKARKTQVDAERPGYKVDHDIVWCRTDGHPIHQRTDYADWCALLAAAKVPHVTLHEARHTTATLLLEAGVDAHVVQAIMGHSDVTTSRAYQHVDLTLSRAALTQIGERLALPATAVAASPSSGRRRAPRGGRGGR